jgi:hypothetical protein
MFEIIKTGIRPMPTKNDGELNLESSSLRKVKLNKNQGIDVDFAIMVYDHVRDEHRPITITMTSSVRCHADLHIVFKRLAAHLALVSESIPRNLEGLAVWMEDGVPVPGQAYSCRSVILKGESGEDNEAVMLSGFKTLSSGRCMNLITPLISLAEEKTDYPSMIPLSQCLEDLNVEVRLYLGGKCADAAQLDIVFADQED